jgi:hypothetical protein
MYIRNNILYSWNIDIASNGNGNYSMSNLFHTATYAFRIGGGKY